jgi:2OG-Fe(II) oxygenase superfamily
VAQAQIPFPAREREAVAIADGATWLKHALPLAEQRALVEKCRAIMDGPAGGYVPTVRGGGKMRVRMVCLGRHWNALTYQYEPTRADHDDAPVAPVPEEWAALASRAARDAGFECTPDLCIVNWYDAGGRMKDARRSRRGCRSCRSRLATPRAFCSAASAAAIRSNRCSWNQEMRLSSADRRGSGITACRGSFPGRRHPSSRSKDDSTLLFESTETGHGGTETRSHTCAFRYSSLPFSCR